MHFVTTSLLERTINICILYRETNKQWFRPRALCILSPNRLYYESLLCLQFNSGTASKLFYYSREFLSCFFFVIVSVYFLRKIGSSSFHSLRLYEFDVFICTCRKFICPFAVSLLGYRLKCQFLLSCKT